MEKIIHYCWFGGNKKPKKLKKYFKTWKKFLPDYKTYGRVAPLKRNYLIVSYCDVVIAFWDGKSRGTEYTINLAKKMNKKVIVYII